MRIIKYFSHSFKSSIKHRIGSNKTNTEHQYYNIWTNKTWLEKQ